MDNGAHVSPLHDPESSIYHPQSTIIHLNDHGAVAEEIPVFASGLEAARGVGDLVADAGKLPEGWAGAGCAAHWKESCRSKRFIPP